MKKYKVITIDVADDELEALRQIGLDIGVELYQNTAEDFQELCFITLEQTKFCIRKETMQKITLEEL